MVYGCTSNFCSFFWGGGGRGRGKDVAVMASNVLKLRQMTDVMTFWCVIWRSLTLNFSYDCDIMIPEPVTRFSASPLLAEPSAANGYNRLSSYFIPGPVPGATTLGSPCTYLCNQECSYKDVVVEELAPDLEKLADVQKII